MATKAMTIAGQRISVAPFSDYLLTFIRELFEEGNLVMDLRKHSAVIEMATELIAPSLPKKLYRKSGSNYYWLGTKDEFAELIDGLYFTYWKYELDAASQAKDERRIATAQEQLDIQAAAHAAVSPVLEPEQPPDDLLAEIERLEAELEHLNPGLNPKERIRQIQAELEGLRAESEVEAD